MNRENWLKNIEGAVFDLDGTFSIAHGYGKR